jgi:hypothetical protein
MIGTTSISSHPGDVQAYLTNDDPTGRLSVGVLRIYVYPLA